MSNRIKLIIILHLCIVFTCLTALLIQPPLKDRTLKKSASILYQEIIGREALFSALSTDIQTQLIDGYTQFQLHASPSYLTAVIELFHNVSPFTLAWIFFSFLVCLLLLFRIEGASHAAWLLPFIIIGYGVTLYTHPPERGDSLFPNETYVIEHYSAEEDHSLLGSKEKLLDAWHRYLVVEWAHETPSLDPSLFQTQVDQGLFAFNVQRLNRLFAGIGEHDLFVGFSWTPSFLLLSLYLAWNVFFAWKVRQW